MKSRSPKWAQFLANVTAYLSHVEAPSYSTLHVLPSGDRALLGLFSRDEILWAKWLRCTCLAWDTGINLHQPFGYDTATAGYRDTRAVASAQFVLHRSNHDIISSWIEIDFDLFNPGRGVGPAILHGIEWLRYRVPKLWQDGENDVTDPWVIRRWLIKSGIEVPDVRKVRA